MKTSGEICELIRLLCDTARKGLTGCYQPRNGSFRVCLPNPKCASLTMASNLRYLIIAQIGIKRWERYVGIGQAALPDLWDLIFSRQSEISAIGDLGLAIWAAVESNAEEYDIFTDQLLSQWQMQNHFCNAVELAWVVQGLVSLAEKGVKVQHISELLTDAYRRLVSLYNPEIQLFARHNRPGLTELFSRRIACFADQVYPILALANYGRHFNDGESVDVAVATADTICRLQGPMGQWWWHYDMQTGKVAEEYPVFSVHQDGMAPMALFAVDAATGTNHRPYIEKGLTWLVEHNEMHEQMIEPDKGIIWRDIHRREIFKMFRFVRGFMITAGLTKTHCLAGKNPFGYVVNRECRPYELGWLLYAWAGEFKKNKQGRISTGLLL